MSTYINATAAEPLVILMRWLDESGDAYQIADIETIVYSIVSLGDPNQETETAVAGHTAQSLVVASTVYDTLQTGDDWIEDDTGYNFRHFLDDGTAFPTADTSYKVTYTVATATATWTATVYVTTEPAGATDGYCTPADVFAAYGRANVTQWADLDNSHNGPAIAGRIATAIDEAKNEIEDRLRGGGYLLPFDPVPTTIRKLAAQYAGVWLYESRGIEDYDETSGKPQHKLAWQRQNFEKVLADIRAGKRTLDAVRITQATRHGGMVPFKV